MKNKNLKQPDKIRFTKATKNDEGIILPINKYYTVENAKTIRYQSSTNILFKLDNCSRCLLDWLTDNVNNYNIVFSYEYQINQFISSYKEATGKEFTGHTVRVAFKKLVDEKLLIRVKHATYQVNPEFFFTGYTNMNEKIRESERHKLIRKNLESSSQIEKVSIAINR